MWMWKLSKGTSMLLLFYSVISTVIAVFEGYWLHGMGTINIENNGKWLQHLKKHNVCEIIPIL